jgi:signal transduction histidine kinase
MNLFTRYSRVNFVASTLAFLVGSFAYYFIIRYVLIHELDDTIKIEEAEILNSVRTRDRLPEPANYRDQQIIYTPSANFVKRHFINTDWVEPGHHEREAFRQLVFSVVVGGRLFTVSIGKSEEETEHLLLWILLITAGVILLLLGTLLLANRLLLRRLWKPFYNTLEGIRQFQLSNRKPLSAADTRVEEFRNLDTAVGLMTNKILKDYDMLKNFADNASHEMQTPLAIINSKLDLMIQDQGLEERHLRQLQAMYDAVGRLSKLNQSLLLLTKIENNQFVHIDEVALAPLIEEKLLQMEDLVRSRRLVVNTGLDRSSTRINAYLADILLNNLLGNAIRHNQEGGRIDIRLREDEFYIANTGAALQFDAATIFDRFTRGQHSGGTGLGLAIVRQICENCGFPIAYSYENGVHAIVVGLPVRE